MIRSSQKLALVRSMGYLTRLRPELSNLEIMATVVSQC